MSAAQGVGNDNENQNQVTEHWHVTDHKQDYYALLLEAASGIAGVPTGDEAAQLNYLARHCHIDRTTLMRQLRKKGALPGWPTLGKLIKGTGVPMRRWLLALRVITLEDAAALLGQEAVPESYSLETRAIARLTERYSPQKRHDLRVFLEHDQSSGNPGDAGADEPQSNPA
jgi:hypothetical protein